MAKKRPMVIPEFLVLKLILSVCLFVGSLRKVLQTSASSRTGSSASSNDVNGYASGRVDVVANNGNIVGVARADSKAISIAKNAIAEATSVAIAKVQKGGKAVAAAKAAASATGKAIAVAKVKTLVKIVSDGENNKGCASAKASAEAEAKAFALAIARVFAKAKNYKAEAIVKAEVAAIQFAHAKAAADSFGTGCLKGKGEIESKQSAFAVAVADVYADVFAKALAAVKGPFSGGALIVGGSADSDEVAVTGGKDESTVSGDGFAFGGTSADAYVDSLFP